jgi:hypothetical protein
MHPGVSMGWGVRPIVRRCRRFPRCPAVCGPLHGVGPRIRLLRVRQDPPYEPIRREIVQIALHRPTVPWPVLAGPACERTRVAHRLLSQRLQDLLRRFVSNVPALYFAQEPRTGFGFGGALAQKVLPPAREDALQFQRWP